MNARNTHQQYRRTFDQGGFTLIEVLVAMAFFFIAVTGISHMLFHSVKNNERSYIATQLDAAIYEQLDTLLCLPYTDANLAEGAHPDIDFRGRVPMHLQKFQPVVSWAIAPTDNIVNGSRMVVATITWNENGQVRRRDLNLLKVRNN